MTSHPTTYGPPWPHWHNSNRHKRRFPYRPDPPYYISSELYLNSCPMHSLTSVGLRNPRSARRGRSSRSSKRQGYAVFWSFPRFELCRSSCLPYPEPSVSARQASSPVSIAVTQMPRRENLNVPQFHSSDKREGGVHPPSHVRESQRTPYTPQARRRATACVSNSNAGRRSTIPFTRTVARQVRASCIGWWPERRASVS